LCRSVNVVEGEDQDKEKEEEREEKQEKGGPSENSISISKEKGRGKGGGREGGMTLGGAFPKPSVMAARWEKEIAERKADHGISLIPSPPPSLSLSFFFPPSRFSFSPSIILFSSFVERDYILFSSPRSCAPVSIVSLAKWAADCAERVLGQFEKDRREDDRPRKAVEGARAWSRGEITVGISQIPPSLFSLSSSPPFLSAFPFYLSFANL